MGQTAMSCRENGPRGAGQHDFEIVEAAFEGYQGERRHRGESIGSVEVKPLMLPSAECHPGSVFRQQRRLDLRMRELFRLQDLKGDGLLDEEELVKLNETIAILHHGRDVDRGAVKAKYCCLFRENLDADGRPVPYETFQRYVLKVLNQMEPYDAVAQEMILDHFICEATSALDLFRCPSFSSVFDAKYMPDIRSGDACRTNLIGMEADLTVVVI